MPGSESAAVSESQTESASFAYAFMAEGRKDTSDKYPRMPPPKKAEVDSAEALRVRQANIVAEQRRQVDALVRAGKAQNLRTGGTGVMMPKSKAAAGPKTGTSNPAKEEESSGSYTSDSEGESEEAKGPTASRKPATRQVEAPSSASSFVVTLQGPVSQIKVRLSPNSLLKDDLDVPYSRYRRKLGLKVSFDEVLMELQDGYILVPHATVREQGIKANDVIMLQDPSEGDELESSPDRPKQKDQKAHKKEKLEKEKKQRKSRSTVS